MLIRSTPSTKRIPDTDTSTDTDTSGPTPSHTRALARPPSLSYSYFKKATRALRYLVANKRRVLYVLRLCDCD